MMRIAAIVALTVASAPAWACNAEMLEPLDWSASEELVGEQLFVAIEASYRYDGGRPVRMIDGFISFEDALGGLVGGIPIDRDQQMKPGEVLGLSLVMTGSYSRMLTLPREDIHVSSCVFSVVYEDGTVERFD